MPYRTEWESPAVMVEHSGVTVFRVYKNNDVEQPRHYWFTLDELETSDESDAAFDVRELPNWTSDRAPEHMFDSHEHICAKLREAIDIGFLEPTSVADEEAQQQPSPQLT
jgi:hypothetical protein